MKHFPFNFKWGLVLFFCISLSSISFAQNIQSVIQTNLQYEQIKNKWDAADIREWRVSDQYTDKESGLTHAYIQQWYNGIPVYNAISIFLLRGNELLYSKYGLISSLTSKVNANAPLIQPNQALNFALLHLGKSTKFEGEQTNSVSKHRVVYELSDIASSPVMVQLVYKQIGAEVKLAWDVSIELKDEAHWWNIRIDALNGIVLDQNDYTLECNLHDEDANAELIEPAGPGVTPSSAIPSYRVFPFPVEAPTFGSRALLIDPSSVIASPYAWHDIDGITGEEYMITRGNNVYAYEDMNNDNQPGYSPDGGSTMTFDFPFVNGASPSANEDACITNLFYACNTIHDYLYPLGFNEDAGNFQTNNYGHGGNQSDAVKAEALDGSGSNNANFSTPPDGNGGRMQMYLWTGNTASCTSLSLSPGGSIAIGAAAFSPPASVTAPVILVNDGAGVLTDACSAIVNNVTGKIALIDRGGTCSYIAKAQAAESAGAVGVIIANNVSGAAPAMTGAPTITIPCVSISLTDGNNLKTALLSGAVNASITTCTVYPVDASFDNGVIAHEYGHGLSNRLTGGPSQASCLSNAEQGGEGWSDWLALMMTIEPGDQGINARGIGTYVRGQASNGPGIRRYPYSTDMSINPQTYAALATSTTVHQIGEIWCDAIWDMSWKLIDNFGFSSNPSNTVAGNNIAMRLVLEGMKLQPCNPGFLDARDAILNADALLFGNAHRCLLWQAFAARGMGFDASQGSSNVVGDEIAGFAMPPFCLPPTSAPIAAFTTDSITITCGGLVHFIDQSTQAFTWSWKFGDLTTSILQHPTHVFNSPGTYLVKLLVSNPLGVDSIIHVITVNPAFNVSVSATPTSVCGGAPISLNAIATGSSNKSYQVTSIPYAPLSTTGTTVILADDIMSTSKPIGFTFNFFGQNYTNFYICSNGFITFSSGMPANVVYGEPLPSTAIPNNLIALAWNDLNPTVSGSSVTYSTTGTAPNRKLVVSYSTFHYLSTTLPFVVQAILYEGSNLIEIHSTTISDASAFDTDATTTQGVENINGSSGVVVPGRNSTLFTANHDAYRFTPYVPYTYIWQPGGLVGASPTTSALSSTIYTVQVSDGTACMATYTSPMVNVIPCSVTLNLTAYIEGYYLGAGLMQPVLLNEGVSSNLNVCDSLQVELHEAVSPDNLIASTSAVLNVNGEASTTFNITPGPYYIVVKHRSGLETWSANPVTFSANPTVYNFTDASSKAYGNNLKLMETGKWAIYSGDVLKDENIDLLDIDMVQNSIALFQYGYIVTDINGDGNVDLLDTPGLEDNVNNFIFSNYP